MSKHHPRTHRPSGDKGGKTDSLCWIGLFNFWLSTNDFFRSFMVDRFNRRNMYKALLLAALLFLSWCTTIVYAEALFSDEPEYTRGPTIPFKAADSYEQALQM